MGVVYKARHLKLKRLVALKMIIAGAHAGPDQAARFLVEAEAVARLQHPNIVQIHEIGEQNGLPFFSLEYVDGGSLDKKLAGNPQDPRAAAALVQTLAQAMYAAHQAGVIHRDLKPANVLLSGEWRVASDEKEKAATRALATHHSPLATLVPKITDFGLAKQLDSAVGQTQSGAVMGTPSYMAPEQAGGKTKEIGLAADVYALGAILYEMLTGRPPFKAASLLDTIQQVQSDEPVPPSRLQPKVPRDLETICLKCLQKEPAKRYCQALDLAEDLGRHQAGEPILARPVGALERMWRWCRRKPGLATASAAALLGVLLALGTFATAFFIVSESRDKAIKLAGEKENARKEADERREHAEKLAVQIRFDQLFSRFGDNPAAALVAAGKLLPDASRLKERSLEDSLRWHLASWRRECHPLRWIGGHNAAVLAVVISADGKTALTGSADHTARLWETATGKPLGPPLQHEGAVSAVAISADGKTALTGSVDKTARLWETATGKPLGPPLQHQGKVTAVAISADGKTVLTGSDDMTARLWRTATGKPVGLPLQHQDRVFGVAISADGKTAVTGNRWMTAQVWNTATGKPIGPPLQHQDSESAVAISADGKTALTGSYDNTGRLWDTATGKPLGPSLQHQDVIRAVAISADGKTALTGSMDKTARLWDTATGKPPGPLLQHQQKVWTVAISADGKTALIGSTGQLQDQPARLWETATGKLLHRVGVSALVAISADGKTALTGNADNTGRLWEMATGKSLSPPLQHQGVVGAVAISADGKTALTGSDDKTARLWDTATGKPIGPPLQHQALVFAVAISADGKIALTGSQDTTARLWDTATGKPIGPPLPHQNAVLRVAISADGKTALTVSHDKTARLWDTATGKPIGLPLQHQDEVVAGAISADGKTALTGSRDKTARVWNTATG